MVIGWAWSCDPGLPNGTWGCLPGLLVEKLLPHEMKRARGCVPELWLLLCRATAGGQGMHKALN